MASQMRWEKKVVVETGMRCRDNFEFALAVLYEGALFRMQATHFCQDPN
jgi:hypothetical protein